MGEFIHPLMCFCGSDGSREAGQFAAVDSIAIMPCSVAGICLIA
jgi:hypothetical protein